MLDSVAHSVACHRLLLGQRLRAVVAVRPVLLAVLPQQPHQPVLLRAGKRPVQEGFRAYSASRLATRMTDKAANANDVFYRLRLVQRAKNNARSNYIKLLVQRNFL